MSPRCGELNESVIRGEFGVSHAFPIAGAVLLIVGAAGCNPPAEDVRTGASSPANLKLAPAGKAAFRLDGNPQPRPAAIGEADPARPTVANETRLLRVPAAGDAPDLPRAEDVNEISLTLTPPWSGKPKCVVSVSSNTHITNFLTQLSGVDWTQEGDDLSEISLELPEIELIVRESSGLLRDDGFSWEGASLIDNVTNRLLEADLIGLRQLACKALIHELAARPSDSAVPAPVGESRQLRVPVGGDVPELPAADVVAVLLQVSQSGADRKCAITVTARPWIENLIGHLGKIDWSQTGVPLVRAQIIAPDIELTVRDASGVHREYGFYWTGTSFVDGGSTPA